MIRTGSLFSQILSLFQRPDFARPVRELKTEHRARGFSSWEPFVAMLFCQLAQARSLRELSDGLKSCEGKLQHLGLAQEPKRSTLNEAAQFIFGQQYDDKRLAEFFRQGTGK